MVARAHEDAYRELEERFAERFGRDEPPAGAHVSPTSADEVALIARIAARHGLPISLRGAGTAPSADKGGVSLRFELMRGVTVRDAGGPVVDLGPGIPWIELEDHLQEGNTSLRVYPTSAPQTTAAGWLARDGLGVGSYEYGWLSSCVVSCELVLPGGARRTVSGEQLEYIVGAEGTTGIIVGATLRLREASRDTPFAAHFAAAEDLGRATAALAAEGLPLWHLGFADPVLMLAEQPGRGRILFGAHSGERAGEVATRLERLVSGYGGELLGTAEAYRVWGARFFPAGTSGEVPYPAQALVPAGGLAEALPAIPASDLAVQGTVARDDHETLLSAFRPTEGGGLETPNRGDAKALVEAARRGGGGEYAVGLRRYSGRRREALVRLQAEVDPEGLLAAGT